MSNASILLCALILDAIFGEPKWLWQRLPHPAVLMGRLIKWADLRFNHGDSKQRNGVVVLVCLCAGAGVLGLCLQMFGDLFKILLVAILMAQKSLVEHVRRVASGLRMSLAQGRYDVSMIVGRNTSSMDETAVARGAIESGAENFSDGVVAPAFWFLLGGMPGLLIYKIVNTADSMIGYKTPKHQLFGWASARFDDLLNLVPARLSAVLIAIPAGVLARFGAIVADARLHRSPNAGWPEAAMARGLNVALSGPRVYEGVTQNFPLVHEEGRRTSGPKDIESACTLLWKAWGLGLAVLVVIIIL